MDATFCSKLAGKGLVKVGEGDGVLEKLAVSHGWQGKGKKYKSDCR